MSQSFFERPILNSPYGYPGQHWELDANGQPTDRILAVRRHINILVARAQKVKQVPGTSLRDVQRLAGHKSLNTAQGYIDSDEEARRALVRLL